VGRSHQAHGAPAQCLLEPADARKILHYLSDEQGLAPEEAKPVEYFPNIA